MLFKSYTNQSSKLTHLATIHGVFRLCIPIYVTVLLYSLKEGKVAHLLVVTGTLMIYLISVCLRPPVLRYWPYGHAYMLGKSQVSMLQLYS